MDIAQQGKLERYFKNASRFLWGLGGGKNQKEVYPWLRTKGKKLWGHGFDFKNGSYHDVQEQLLQNPGIEKLLKGLIVSEVKKKFSDQALAFLQLSWNAGTLPMTSYLKQYNILNAYPFLEINNQFNYVERWGEFAGVWFEEIEPYLREAGESDGGRL